MTLEDIDHIKVIDWFRYDYPLLKQDLHHFANQRRCTPIEGRKLKRMGVMRGVSDFFLAISKMGYHGLWIELKVGNGKLSQEQIDFLKRKNEQGYLAVALWGFEDVKKFIQDYLNESISF